MEQSRNDRFSWVTGRRHNVAYWGLLGLACVVFLIMNFLTPYKEDDMAFTLIEGMWTPIRSIGDALRSLGNHFAGTNGRLADVVPTFFCGLLGKTLFNVCNTLVFGLLALLLSRLSTGRRSVTALALWLAVVGTCYPVPGETMLWLSGSANYMWAITASLLVVAFLNRFKGRKPSWGGTVLLALGALVAGGFNEATSFGFLAGLVLYYAVNRDRFNARVAVVLAAYLVGVLLIVSSPAAWERAANGGIALNLPADELFKSRCYIFNEKLWRFLLPVLAIAVGVGALVLRRGRVVKQTVWTYIFLGLSLVMFALGIVHERAYAPWVTVAFIIVMMAADGLFSRWRWLRAAALAIALALAVFTFGRGIKVMGDFKHFDHQTQIEIQNSSTDQAILQERQFDAYSRFIKPVNYRSTDFFAHELVYRAYYGKRNVQFVNDSVLMRYKENRLLDGAVELPVTTDRPDLGPVVYTFDNQPYIAIRLNLKDLPCTFQTARYYAASNVEEQDEVERRAKYGINLDYTPAGFYPLDYQGQCYLIGVPLGSMDQRMVFPLTMPPDPEEITLEIKR